MDICYKYPDLVPPKSHQAIEGNLKKICVWIGSGCFIGLVLNIQAKNIYPKMLTLPMKIKIPFRCMLFFTPIFFSYSYFVQPLRQGLNDELEKLYLKLKKLGKDKDLSDYYLN